MAEGEFALVRQHLEAALKSPSHDVGEHELYAMLADAAAQQRDEAALRQYAPLAEELAARYGHILCLAIAHRAWGVLRRLTGEHTESEARLQKAMGLFQQLDTRWQIGRTLCELGELAAARHDPDQARGYFMQALTAFEALKAAPDAARARAALESLL